MKFQKQQRRKISRNCLGNKAQITGCFCFAVVWHDILGLLKFHVLSPRIVFLGLYNMKIRLSLIYISCLLYNIVKITRGCFDYEF